MTEPSLGELRAQCVSDIMLVWRTTAHNDSSRVLSAVRICFDRLSSRTSGEEKIGPQIDDLMRRTEDDTRAREQKAAEEMRERAATAVEAMPIQITRGDTRETRTCKPATFDDAAAAIRALPLSPPGTDPTIAQTDCPEVARTPEPEERTTPFLPASLEDSAETANVHDWNAEALETLAKMLGLGNDYYYPLIGSAQLIRAAKSDPLIEALTLIRDRALKSTRDSWMDDHSAIHSIAFTALRDAEGTVPTPEDEEHEPQ